MNRDFFHLLGAGIVVSVAHKLWRRWQEAEAVESYCICIFKRAKNSLPICHAGKIWNQCSFLATFSSCAWYIQNSAWCNIEQSMLAWGIANEIALAGRSPNWNLLYIQLAQKFKKKTWASACLQTRTFWADSPFNTSRYVGFLVHYLQILFNGTSIMAICF